jgi:hypothetical protein
MKIGKYIPLGEYKNVKIGYGTVDFKNLKTIYIILNSWIEPLDENNNFDKLVNKSRRNIKEIIFNLKNNNFKNESIVDLDIKTKGIMLDKRSFMNLEITLYVENFFDVKSKDTKESIKKIIELIIDDGLNNKNLFNFFKNKK